jgi:hypothetical protein
MSNLSQFAGGVGYIDLEVFMIAGGGGGGGSSPTYQPGGGGAGGIYYGVVSVRPASTCPVTVGAGGGVGPSPSSTPGSRGGDTSITCPVGTYRVVGGGGGDGGNGVALEGGCGGGGSNFTPIPSAVLGARSIYRVGLTTSELHYVSTKNGDFYGYPGGTSLNTGGNGGHSGGPGYYDSSTPLINNFRTDITGTFTSYGFGGPAKTYPGGAAAPSGAANTGDGGGGNYTGTGGGAGGSGFVVVRYPTQFAVSSYTPAPAVVDLSPATPGYRTYKFNASASITLP